MMKLRQTLKGKKTYIVSTLMVAIALVEVAYGDMTVFEFLQDGNVELALEGLGLATLRAGLSKATERRFLR